MYHTEPPTDKTIREWHMNSSRVAACALRNEQAVRTHMPGRPVHMLLDMLLSAVSVLVVAQSSSEIPEGLMNNPVFIPLGIGHMHMYIFLLRMTDTMTSQNTDISSWDSLYMMII